MFQANGFHQNWGQVIFQSANEINQNNLLKERAAEVQAQLGAEKEWWEGRRAGIQESFMKELDAEAAAQSTDAAPVKKSGSDDDAVLVDAGGPEDALGGKKGKGGKKK